MLSYILGYHNFVLNYICTTLYTQIHTVFLEVQKAMNRSRMFSLVSLALLLASIGAVAAMWTSTLRVNVAVQTGDVSVAWVKWSCSDKGPDPQIPGSKYSNTEGKNVASCIITPEVTDSHGNVLKLNVTIHNAYPGYHVVVYMTVKNIGTIPVKLYTSSLTGGSPGAVTAQLIKPADTQIDAGNTSQYQLVINVEDGATQNSTYTFQLTLVFAQWNEVSGP